MGKFANDLIAGMTEAVAYANGTKSGATAHVVETPDVRAIRRQLHMSQHEFADAYRIPLATLKNWEQGRRVPEPQPPRICRRSRVSLGSFEIRCNLLRASSDAGSIRDEEIP